MKNNKKKIEMFYNLNLALHILESLYFMFHIFSIYVVAL